jgi:hypothetical protein
MIDIDICLQTIRRFNIAAAQCARFDIGTRNPFMIRSQQFCDNAGCEWKSVADNVKFVDLATPTRRQFDGVSFVALAGKH